jgi:hypothetical protein
VFAATILDDGGTFRDALGVDHWTSTTGIQERLLEDKLAVHLASSESDLGDEVKLGLDFVHVNNSISNLFSDIMDGAGTRVCHGVDNEGIYYDSLSGNGWWMNYGVYIVQRWAQHQA